MSTITEDTSDKFILILVYIYRVFFHTYLGTFFWGRPPVPGPADAGHPGPWPGQRGSQDPAEAGERRLRQRCGIWGHFLMVKDGEIY